jgi:large subunit ribosomal protein L15
MESEAIQLGLNNLQAPKGSRKTPTRKGRGPGSGLGTQGGRGGKGQTARTGSGGKLGFEGGQTPLQRRLPKFGFKNPFRKTVEVVNLSDLESRFEAGSVIDVALLAEKGLVNSASSYVKVLGDGNLTKKFTVKAHKFSKSAIKKINQAGGQVEEITSPSSEANKSNEE